MVCFSLERILEPMAILRVGSGGALSARALEQPRLIGCAFPSNQFVTAQIGDGSGYFVDRMTFPDHGGSPESEIDLGNDLLNRPGFPGGGMQTDLVLDALEQALYARQGDADAPAVCQ